MQALEGALAALQMPSPSMPQALVCASPRSSKRPSWASDASGAPQAPSSPERSGTEFGGKMLDNARVWGHPCTPLRQVRWDVRSNGRTLSNQGEDQVMMMRKGLFAAWIAMCGLVAVGCT